MIYGADDHQTSAVRSLSSHRVRARKLLRGNSFLRAFPFAHLLRTIEDVLGLPPLGLHDGLAEPMSEVFDLSQAAWSYGAVVPDVLRSTQLPLEAPTQKKSELGAPAGCFLASRDDAAWWEAATAGQDFREEDRLDVDKFNAALWAGLKGEGSTAADRPPADLRIGRQDMLSTWRKAHDCN